jgi:hypothetical protein
MQIFIVTNHTVYEFQKLQAHSPHNHGTLFVPHFASFLVIEIAKNNKLFCACGDLLMHVDTESLGKLFDRIIL